MELRKSWFWALYICTRPPSADACPPAEAKSDGTKRVLAPRGSIERNDPGSWSARAGGSPKFDVLPTRIRAGSRTLPGCVKAASAGLSWIGPPGRKVPTALIADAPGMPTATTRPPTVAGSEAFPVPALKIMQKEIASVDNPEPVRCLTFSSLGRQGYSNHRACQYLPRFHQIYIRDNKKESSFTLYFQP